MADKARISKPKRTRITVRKQPVQQRAQLLCKSLLDATAAILVRHGYEGLSTNRVAEEAGVSVGSLYQYFPNKESLVAALIERWSDSVMKTLSDQFLAVREESIEAAVEALVQATLDTSRINVKLHRILLQQVPHVQASPALTAFHRRMIDIVSSWLDLHRDKLEVTDVHMAAELLVIALSGLSDHALLDRPELLDSTVFVRHLCRLVLGYLAPSKVVSLAQRI